ncbi:MAG: 16S rRNA (cytosine(1402)-N(4))-methyltransferase RsmH [Spirochaetales bacterium]|nr:16S rRNA (cytosine(1402)-N(4))-methyltransferase RsmH [Spirochaetales bacterium]
MSALETKKASWHPSILTTEILDHCPESCRRILDGTLGDGGHTLALAQKFPRATILATELDPEMLKRAEQRLQLAGQKVEIVSYPFPDTLPAGIFLCGRSYADIEEADQFDFILLDLGVSTYQLREAGRGFSFHDDLLDMRFSKDGPTAAEILNDSSLSVLTEILKSSYLPAKAAQLAGRLIKNRPYRSARELTRLFGSTSRKHHPATLIFQALRMAVNQESANIERALQQMPPLLSVGGRLAILSFHSGEDRSVKQSFRLLGQNNFRLLTRHAIKPGYQEVQQNRQARSARLRVVERLADNET